MMARKSLRATTRANCPRISNPVLLGRLLCWPALLLCIALLRPAAGASPTEAVPQPTSYMIVVTGGELLSGAYPDGHTYFITRTLHRVPISRKFSS